MLAFLHYDKDWLVVPAAFFLDFACGDPSWFPHPVRGIGWMIQRAETVLRKFTDSPKAEKIAGVVLVVTIVLLVYVLSSQLVLAAVSFSPVLGSVLSVALAYTTLAARGLADAGRGVLSHLDAGDIARARVELSMIVGRDTMQLDEPEITRAVVETIAENASDGVIAPIFYLAIGGPALALAYKAVNTLDSMVGYKNERYLNFGWAAAKLDDAANYIPARVTAGLICLSSTMFALLRSMNGGPRTGTMNSWRIMFRDGRNHQSPNSGYPEAAMAGALGIRLGGQNSYFGTPSLKPFIGDATHVLDKKYIEKSVRLMYCASLFALLLAAFLSGMA